MSRTKRKGDGPAPGIRNWAKGRIGSTRHRKADRAKNRSIRQPFVLGPERKALHDEALEKAEPWTPT